MPEILNDLKLCSDELARTLTRDFVTDYLEQGGDPETFKGTLSPVEQQNIKFLRTILLEPEFQGIIGTQTVTFAMIRPSLNLGSQEGADQEIAERIFRQIEGRGFGIPVNLSWPIGRKRIESFYQHVATHMLEMPFNDYDGTPSNRWDVFLNLCIGGGTSLLVLSKELAPGEKPVWEQWRGFIGNKIISRARGGTIRKIFGSEYNNIAHGSDSKRAVQGDISWMTEQLK